jgi:hypothetical protein
LISLTSEPIFARRYPQPMRSSKFQFEQEIVDRFLRELGYSDFSLSDPNAGQRVDTGADVLVNMDGHRYGVQVTIYHSDEGALPVQKGSALRSQEAAYKGWPTAYAMFGKPSPWSAVAYRLHSKCSKEYPSGIFDELVLLVAASLPSPGATASTLLLDLALDLETMNCVLAPYLRASRYSEAYIYNMMGVGGASVYEWTRATDLWSEIPRAALYRSGLR